MSGAMEVHAFPKNLSHNTGFEPLPSSNAPMPESRPLLGSLIAATGPPLTHSRRPPRPTLPPKLWIVHQSHGVPLKLLRARQFSCASHQRSRTSNLFFSSPSIIGCRGLACHDCRTQVAPF